MNIKDTYLHGGTHIVKKIEFIVPASGSTNAGNLVMRTTWASVDANGNDKTDDTVINILNAKAFSAVSHNTVLAGPQGTQDSNNTPTFRSLVAADIPGTLGTTTFAGDVSVGDASHTAAALSVKGNTTIGGNLTVGGNTTLGDASTDTLTINSSSILFPNATMLDWNSGTYRLRLVLTDSSDVATKVFKFLQSSDSGAKYGDLMSIDSDGNVTANKFTGELAGNATTATLSKNYLAVSATLLDGPNSYLQIYKVSLTNVTEPYDGLTIRVKFPDTAPGSTNSYLTINDTNNSATTLLKPIYYRQGTLATSTYLIANADVILTYRDSPGLVTLSSTVARVPTAYTYNGTDKYAAGMAYNSGGWVMSYAYDSGNTNTLVRVYKDAAKEGTYDADLPIIVSRTALASINSSGTGVYGVVSADSAIAPTINPATGTIKAPLFIGAITGNVTGNADTASNLSKGSAGRGFLYLSADTTTSCLGVPLAPSTSGNTHIGIPTQTRANGSDTVNYVLDVSLFIKKTAGTYLGDNIKSAVFVKTNTTSPAGTLEGSSSSDQGSTGSGSGTSYAAGTGLKLSGTTFSTNTWTGTLAQFNALSAASANSYDVIYIIEE